MRERINNFCERRISMTISTLSAGFLIVVVTVALELLEKDNKRKEEEFLNFE